uniref:uncharacterized protein n=1 Tax=Centroberyx gerrardi TaxID=166262 RepID=UPI003AAAB951
MASASYTEDLTCSICLTLFTDPVSLLCGHSFCRKCITICLSAQDQCPQCRTTVPTEEKYLPTSHILKSLAEKAKEAEKIKKEPGNEKTEVAECLCPEHEEKLKLFCETDQQLACVICRDGERHDGHKFKPIKEAAASRRRELEKGMKNLPDDIRAIESLANTQREEITKTQETSRQLMTQISTQFEEMHQFLRKREDEIKKELQEKEREAVEKMSEKLNAMNTALSERRELEVKATSVLEIQDSERFLQSWTEANTMMTRERLFRPRAKDLQVTCSSLCLGPYESHLQFFVWKEMLQVIKPRAELLSLKTDNTDIPVSDDGRSLFCTSKSSQPQLFCNYCGSSFRRQHNSPRKTNHAFSSSKFTSGQHYWETEKSKGEHEAAMASASYTEDLTCSICLTLFTDPVSLLCGHSFCRKCITICLSAQDQCPQCRATVPTEEKYFPTNHILKSLAEKAKEAEKIKKEPGNEKTEVAECLCPEHEEKLKLFCETDQQLACVVCRDGERHDGHKFKPIKEAATSRRQELEKGLENLSADIHAIESLANTQREEITKTQETSRQLMSQISTQFEEMHQFLRKREDEIKKELQKKEREAIEKISEKLNIIDMALSERRELEVKATSVLEIQDSERFLQSWTEDNTMMTPERLFRPRAKDLQVTCSSLCLGPYESHLQFFVWKEMLQVIKPRAELLSLKRNNTGVTVSDDGRSLFCKSKSVQSQPGFSFGNAQAKGSSPFGTPFGSTQATGSSPFGTPFGSTQATGSSPFGTPFGSTQATGSSPFGTPFGSTQATGSFGRPFGSTQATGSSPFGTPFGSTERSFDDRKRNHAFSFNKFTSGQHYWEIDVGKRDYWELGVKDNFLKYDGQKYAICSQSSITELTFTGRPQKFGIYLNCSSKELSFYDADNMKHVHTMSPSFMCMPVSAYFNVGYSKDTDPNPLTVCWY